MKERLFDKSRKKISFLMSVLLVVAMMVSVFVPEATKQAGMVKAAFQIFWPVPSSRTLNQGFHDGRAIDIGGSEGCEIDAAMGGRVTHVFTCGLQHYKSDHICHGFGTGVVIAGNDGRTYQYAHMQANSIPAYVFEGATVSTGQKIGCMGKTGNASGVHLHFGISIGNYWNGAGINPDPNAGAVSYIYGNSPEGCIDFVEGGKNSISIQGWAFDRDNLGTSIDIHVYVGGPAGVGYGYQMKANGYRPDVNNVYGCGNNHGFSGVIKLDKSIIGMKSVYIYAINIGSGENRLLGQRDAAIVANYDPQGHTDAIEGKQGGVRVMGWAFDRDNTGAALDIHVYIGGPAGTGAEYHVIKANTYRQDIQNAYGTGAYHGFDSVVKTNLTGKQPVYVYAINTGGGSNNPLIGSGNVTITANPAAAVQAPKQVTQYTPRSFFKKQLRVDWGTLFDSDGYEVQYALNNNFNSAKTITISSKFTSSRTITGLTSKKTYYTRVRAYKNSGNSKVYGNWSAVKSCKVK